MKQHLNPGQAGAPACGGLCCDLKEFCGKKILQFIQTPGKLFVLGIKQQLVDMILSYNTLWLRIGLEVSYPMLWQIKLTI